MLLYEMKFIVPNYSCLQNPWLGGYRPQIPVLSVFCLQLNLLKPPRTKIPGYATGHDMTSYTRVQFEQWRRELTKWTDFALLLTSMFLLSSYVRNTGVGNLLDKLSVITASSGGSPLK